LAPPFHERAFGVAQRLVSDERDIYVDYKQHIGGPAKSVVRVWLLGVSLFQRRPGSCRFGDITGG
jgi:hypothetical protein